MLHHVDLKAVHRRATTKGRLQGATVERVSNHGGVRDPDVESAERMRDPCQIDVAAPLGRGGVRVDLGHEELGPPVG